MRPGTRVLLILLVVLIAVAATVQLVIASRDREPFRGPTSTPNALP
ncbi:MAG: hypothetical protein WD757_03375 [Actinomycetota bacterium]